MQADKPKMFNEDGSLTQEAIKSTAKVKANKAIYNKGVQATEDKVEKGRALLSSITKIQESLGKTDSGAVDSILNAVKKATVGGTFNPDEVKNLSEAETRMYMLASDYLKFIDPTSVISPTEMQGALNMLGGEFWEQEDVRDNSLQTVYDKIETDVTTGSQKLADMGIYAPQTVTKQTAMPPSPQTTQEKAQAFSYGDL
ncbi:MAG: hypothetical protein DRQ24_12325 [Candidatus Latescibacterota bacterium]|nr:MAG: hypothetical protein DRQ24_12325 [Candidatus Latescibacterota bacterium]